MIAARAAARDNPDDASSATAAEPRSPPTPAREERKVVTAVFVDLVGSTARAEQLDPEDVRALLRRYHETLRRALEGYGGTVEKFIGDAVVAVYGAPTAHEDDPERAVRAALAAAMRSPTSTSGTRRSTSTSASASHTGEALVSRRRAARGRRVDGRRRRDEHAPRGSRRRRRSTGSSSRERRTARRSA